MYVKRFETAATFETVSPLRKDNLIHPRTFSLFFSLSLPFFSLFLSSSLFFVVAKFYRFLCFIIKTGSALNRPIQQCTVFSMRFELNFFPRPRSFFIFLLLSYLRNFYYQTLFVRNRNRSITLTRITFSYLSSFTDTETDKQGTPAKRQQENNNSVFANEKSPEKRTNGIVVETSNASMVNTPDLSPVKNIRNGEVEDTEVRKTKVTFHFPVPS